MQQHQQAYRNYQTVQGYDFHIYFFQNNPQSVNSAKQLMKAAQTTFPTLPMKMFEKIVGPHPMGMFQIEIDQDSIEFTRVLSWLMLNHGEHSVLLHPHTGDSVADHTVHPFWLGQKVPLDVSKL
jgi:aromatic ring-cleaving dioxygenase